MKTISANPATVKRDWFVVDAEGKTLGRLSAEIASRLRGKHKPEYTPHVDTGDYIVVINAEKVRLTGNKENAKIYTHYTGYVGNQKIETPKKVRQRNPKLLVERAVRGMVPHNKLGNAIFKKLNVYAGTEHPHEAQTPEVFEIK